MLTILEKYITSKVVDNPKNDVVKGLVEAIKKFLSNNLPVKELSYEDSLFHNFCQSSSRKWVGICKYNLLPPELKKILLFNKRPKLSFINIACLFGAATKLIFSELTVKEMSQKVQTYIDAMKVFVAYASNASTVKVYLKEVIFESENQDQDQSEMITQMDNKLKKLADRHKKNKWHIKYWVYH